MSQVCEHFKVNKERNNSGPRPDRVCLKSSQSRSWGIKSPRPLWATFWNPVSKRKDGRGRAWREEREWNGGGEELFSKCTKQKKDYIFLKSMDLIKSRLVLFFSVIQNALVTISVLHFPYTPLSPVLIPHTTHSTGTISRSYFLNWNLLSSVTAWLPPMCPLHRVFGKGKVMFLCYIRVPSHESDRNHIQRTLGETL